ncbi:MAG: hypothetical protein HZA91_01925 [Verrucomicrobia bacterium]|nr:hypothetical protein [Verrucomicrobiota bacterium]
MSDIVFDCPHCGKHLEVADRGAGLTVPCPECGKKVAIPAPGNPPLSAEIVKEPGVQQRGRTGINNAQRKMILIVGIVLAPLLLFWGLLERREWVAVFGPIISIGVGFFFWLGREKVAETKSGGSKRIGVRTRAVFGLLLALTVLVIGAFCFVEAWPRKETMFWDIPLGASCDDVRFLKGKPTAVNGHAWGYVLKKGQEFSAGVTVSFRNGKVFSVIAHDLSRGEGRGKWDLFLRSLHFGDTWRLVVDRLGTPRHIETSENGLARIACYPEQNLCFLLKANRVEVYGIYDSSQGSPLRFLDSATPKRDENGFEIVEPYWSVQPADVSDAGANPKK